MSKDQTTTASPFAPARDDLRKVVNSAGRRYSAGNLTGDVYTGDRVAQFSPETQTALGGLSMGSGLGGVSADALTGMMSDDAMYRDFDTIRGVIADDVKAQLGSTFSGGSINSGLAGDTYTRALTEALATAEFGAYNDAQNRKLSAVGLAPSISGMQTDEEKAALAAGLTIDDLNQRNLDADIAEFREVEDADLNALKEYANIAMGVGGMGGTTTSPVSFIDQLTGLGRAASGVGGFYDAIWG